MASKQVPAPAANGLSHGEREQMLLAVGKLVKSEVRRAKIPERHQEDLAQDVQLELWKASEKFDPNRGVKWSTFACSVMKRTLANWKAANNSEIVAGGVVSIGSSRAFDETIDFRAGADPNAEQPDDDDEGVGDTGGGLLANAVRRVLAKGILDKLGDGHRRLVEMVAFEGLDANQIALQYGWHVKVVRLNLKNALRTLCRAGLVNHVVTDQEIRNGTAPREQRTSEVKKQARRLQQARHAADRQMAAEITALLAVDGTADVLDEFGADVKALVLAVAAKRLEITQAGTRLGLHGERTRELFRRVVAALRSHSPATAAVIVKPPLVRTRIVTGLDALASREGFHDELQKLDADTTVLVTALIDRSFTLDEAVELLGGDRQAALARLRVVKEKLTRGVFKRRDLTASASRWCPLAR